MDEKTFIQHWVINHVTTMGFLECGELPVEVEVAREIFNEISRLEQEYRHVDDDEDDEVEL